MALCAADLSATNLAPSVASNQVPKTGTVIPNRIFVGGIATQTTDLQLKEFFSAYGAVKDTKIICDRAGVSKGYGFVTFETQEDAEKIITKESENLVFKDRKLNIGPAVRKQQTYARLIDGFPPASGAHPMFVTSPYAYATTGGLTVMPPEAYQQALQQQVQPQVGAAGYPNVIIPTAQVPTLYMPQTAAFPYSSPVQTQVGAALPCQNPSQPWLPANCYQPPVPVSAAGLYQDVCSTISTNPGITTQYVEMTDGAIQESVSDPDTRNYPVATSAEGIQLNTCQSINNLMSVQPGRVMQQSHGYHASTSVSPQPPPVKRLATAPTHFPVSCFNTPLNGSYKPAVLQAARAPAGIAYMHHGLGGKYEQEVRLAASIAPPTPPATPAAASTI